MTHNRRCATCGQRFASEPAFGYRFDQAGACMTQDVMRHHGIFATADGWRMPRAASSGPILRRRK
jgi:hypothetical protein